MTLWVTTKNENSRSGEPTEFQQVAGIFEGDRRESVRNIRRLAWPCGVTEPINWTCVEP